MKTIELQVNKIKPNPFKKYINNGKLDEDILVKIEESINHGTLPMHFTVRESNGLYELSSGHHRVEAIKRKKGKDFKVQCTIVDFSDELMLVDMIRENLTHRDSDFRDVKDSVVLARTWLQSKAQRVERFNTLYPEIIKGKKGFQQVDNSSRSIQKFLSKQGKTIHYSTIKNYLDIHDKLDPKILEVVGKTESATQEEKQNKLGVRLATKLASVDKKDQLPLYDQIKKSKLNSDILSGKISAFKQADKTIKNKILSGEENLENIDVLGKILPWSKEKRETVLLSNAEGIVEFNHKIISLIERTKEINSILLVVIKKDVLRKAGTKQLNEIERFLTRLDEQQKALNKLLKKSQNKIKEAKRNVLN